MVDQAKEEADGAEEDGNDGIEAGQRWAGKARQSRVKT